jgi:DNA-binding transcriptional ArsR family regulator
MHSKTQTASTDTLLQVVADPDRRAILRHLHATDSRSIAVDDLARAIESHEGATDSDAAQTVIELRHTHLPMLADANAITYDRGRESVAYRGDDDLEALLEFLAERLE